jgi:hypothetical protein
MRAFPLSIWLVAASTLVYHGTACKSPHLVSLSERDLETTHPVKCEYRAFARKDPKGTVIAEALSG